MPNPGVGGWAAIVCVNGKECQLSGAKQKTTNNEMEFTAILNGLEEVARGLSTGMSVKPLVSVFSDSQLAINVLSRKWRCKKPHLQVIVDKIWATSERLGCVSYQWVPAHSGIPMNERADSLASAAMRKLRRGC